MSLCWFKSQLQTTFHLTDAEHGVLLSQQEQHVVVRDWRHSQRWSISKLEEHEVSCFTVLVFELR